MDEESYAPTGSFSYEEEIPRPLSDEEASFSRWQLDPQQFLENIANNLRGKVRNADGDWVEPQSPNPRVSEEGVRDIISSLELGIFQKFTPLSILDEKDIKKICYIRGHILANLIVAKYRAYEIDPQDILSLQDDIMTSVFTYLSRAKDGQTLHGFQKMHRSFERVGDDKKGGEAGIVKSFFGKSSGGK